MLGKDPLARTKWAIHVLEQSESDSKNAHTNLSQLRQLELF